MNLDRVVAIQTKEELASFIEDLGEDLTVSPDE